LSADSNQAKAIRRKIPEKLMRLYMMTITVMKPANVSVEEKFRWKTFDRLEH
jgi:hypothetical protein